MIALVKPYEFSLETTLPPVFSAHQKIPNPNFTPPANIYTWNPCLNQTTTPFWMTSEG